MNTVCGWTCHQLFIRRIIYQHLVLLQRAKVLCRVHNVSLLLSCATKFTLQEAAAIFFSSLPPSGPGSIIPRAGTLVILFFVVAITANTTPTYRPTRTHTHTYRQTLMNKHFCLFARDEDSHTPPLFCLSATQINTHAHKGRGRDFSKQGLLKRDAAPPHLPSPFRQPCP